MNNAQAFKQAHAMTKATIKQGDSYAATFGICLKLVIEQNKAQAKQMTNKVSSVVFHKPPIFNLVCAMVCALCVVVFFAPVVMAIIGRFTGFALDAHNASLMMIEVFKIGSAFGIASLILSGVYRLLGWGRWDDVVKHA